MFGYDQSGQWAQETTVLPEHLADQVFVMVHTRADDGPLAAAHDVCQQIKARLFLTTGSPSLQADRICVIIQNFGTHDDPAVPSNRCSFITNFTRPAAGGGQTPPDGFASTGLVWPEPLNADGRDGRINPWLTNGTENCKEWMQAFLAAYDTWWASNVDAPSIPPSQRPVPARFHFDCEYVITNLGSANWTRLFTLAASDPRWSQVPLKGFGGQTGADLWASFASHLGLSNTPAEMFTNPLGVGDTPQAWSPDNQRVMLWWNQITLRIKEAALHEAAYQVIKQHQGWDTDSQGKWAACKVSNYESVGLTGGITSAGRRHQIRHAPSTIPAISPYRRSPNSPATYVSESSSVSDTLPEVWAKHGAFPSRLWNNFDAGGGFIVSGEWGQPSRP